MYLQVWRARDAISDSRYQVQAYLEHHWVIIKLVPCYAIGGEHADRDGGAPNHYQAFNTILEEGAAGAELDDSASQSKRAAFSLDSLKAKRVAGAANDAFIDRCSSRRPNQAKQFSCKAKSEMAFIHAIG
jgi:hypothetical protein